MWNVDHKIRLSNFGIVCCMRRHQGDYKLEGKELSSFTFTDLLPCGVLFVINFVKFILVIVRVSFLRVFTDCS
jgi:hypothetical protein